MDYFSKWPETVASSNFTAETAAEFLYNRLICRYGVPERIITDQGPNFESLLIKELCGLMNIGKLRSTAYHPATNGLVERYNRTLKQMLSCFVNEQTNKQTNKMNMNK
jgi:transposase InsO family protein